MCEISNLPRSIYTETVILCLILFLFPVFSKISLDAKCLTSSFVKTSSVSIFFLPYNQLFPTTGATSLLYRCTNALRFAWFSHIWTVLDFLLTENQEVLSIISVDKAGKSLSVWDVEAARALKCCASNLQESLLLTFNSRREKPRNANLFHSEPDLSCAPPSPNCSLKCHRIRSLSRDVVLVDMKSFFVKRWSERLGEAHSQSERKAASG